LIAKSLAGSPQPDDYLECLCVNHFVLMSVDGSSLLFNGGWLSRLTFLSYWIFCRNELPIQAGVLPGSFFHESIELSRAAFGGCFRLFHVAAK
jgi:hypothetical protein